VCGDECGYNSEHAATSCQDTVCFDNRGQDTGCMVTRIQMRLGMCHKSECRFKSDIGIQRLQEDNVRSEYRVGGDK
jgi:hypothetical protein